MVLAGCPFSVVERLSRTSSMVNSTLSACWVAGTKLCDSLFNVSHLLKRKASDLFAKSDALKLHILFFVLCGFPLRLLLLPRPRQDLLFPARPRGVSDLLQQKRAARAEKRRPLGTADRPRGRADLPDGAEAELRDLKIRSIVTWIRPKYASA